MDFNSIRAIVLWIIIGQYRDHLKIILHLHICMELTFGKGEKMNSKYLISILSNFD